MASAWPRLQRRHWACPNCQDDQLEGSGSRSFELLTLFGKVTLPRRRVRCLSCGQPGQPLDGWLEDLGEHRATLAVRELLCLVGISWPYQAAETVLERLLTSSVSHEQIRRLTIEEGERAVDEQESRAKAVLGEPIFLAEGQGESEPGEVNVVLDGDWVRSRDNPEGMEGKVGVVYTGVETIGKNGDQERKRLVNRRYAATFKGSSLLGKLVYAEATRFGVEKVEQVRVLGDGAAWIDTLTDEHFPRAERVLDLWHLERQISRALKVTTKDEGERSRRRRELIGLIRKGKTDQVLGVLRELISAFAPDEAPKELAGTILYVESHRRGIVDYEAEMAEGEHVGSGGIEKAGDLVINRRFKGRRGMTWWRRNANALAALRVCHLNGDWDAYWQARHSLLPAA